MSYFDRHKHTEVVVNASPSGLGAILAQSHPRNEMVKIIAYGSRSLTPVEMRYSQTEREALTIVWSCEHINIYLYPTNLPSLPTISP